MHVGYPVLAEAVAMAGGINIPAVFHDRFNGVEEVFVEYSSYCISIRPANAEDKSGVVGERVKLERKNKQRGKNKTTPQIRVPFSERIWHRLNYYQRNAGQRIKLTFNDEGDYLFVQFG